MPERVDADPTVPSTATIKRKANIRTRPCASGAGLLSQNLLPSIFTHLSAVTLMSYLMRRVSCSALFALGAAISLGACGNATSGTRDQVDPDVIATDVEDASDGATDAATDATTDGADALMDLGVDADETNDDGADAPDDTDAEDADEADAADAADTEPVPDCDTVCVAFIGVPETTVGDGVARVVTDDCNAFGLEAGVCPGTLECVELPPRWVTFGLLYDTPVCVLDGDANFVFDVGPPADAVAVELRFTLNGGAWPARAADMTVLVSPRDEGRQLERLLLSDEDTLSLLLPPGVYDLDFSKPPRVGDPLPIIVERARLIVATAGEATLDVEASPVAFQIDLDGESLLDAADRTAAQLRLAARLKRPDGFLWAFTVQPSEAIAPITVQHGTYSLEVSLASSLRGRLGESPAVEIAAPGETLRVAGETAPLTARFESAGEGALGTANLRLSTPNVQGQFPIGDDGTLDAVALSSEFDALLFSTSSSDDGRFEGAVALGTVTPPATLDQSLTFARGTFRVFVDDERLEVFSFARVDLVTEDGSVSTLAFDETGLATGTVLDVPAEIRLIGDGRAVPGGTTVLGEWEPTALPTRLDVTGARAVVTVAVDGDLDWPGRPNAGASLVTFRRVSEETDRLDLFYSAFNPNGRTDGVSVTIADDMEAIVSPLLSPGRWQAETLVNIDDTQFVQRSAPFDVPGDPVRIDIDRRSITVTLEEGGRELAAGSRGQIVFDGRAATLPTSGAATVTLPDVYRETDITWFCSAEVLCSDPMWVGRTVLTSGLLP